MNQSQSREREKSSLHRSVKTRFTNISFIIIKRERRKKQKRGGYGSWDNPQKYPLMWL